MFGVIWEVVEQYVTFSGSWTAFVGGSVSYSFSNNCPQTVCGFNPVGFPVINKLSLPLSVPSGTKVLRRKMVVKEDVISCSLPLEKRLNENNLTKAF